MARIGPNGHSEGIVTDLAAENGWAELRAARAGSGKALIAAFVFSVFVNLLMLTAPLYMLQVYDRVLASRSEPTLVALSLLAAFLFLIMGLLDHARGRLLARIGLRLQTRMERRVFGATLGRLRLAEDAGARMARHDLDVIGRLWASPLLPALLDLPWSPIFLGLLFLFHPLLGWFALAGAGLLALLTWGNRRTTAEAGLLAHRADHEAEALASGAGDLHALGMRGSALDRWVTLRAAGHLARMRAGETGAAFASASKILRLFLQSAVLGLGAWLVLHNELSAGAMIAGSILLGRALQPIEQVIGQWALLAQAGQARARLARFLADTPVEVERTPLPRPAGRFEMRNLTLIPPGAAAPVLRGISFSLDPGQALAVIGNSGAGKSSLARALTGIWPESSGQIRLDGIPISQFGAEYGRLIGYLPQRVTLIAGTIAENIARLAPDARPEQIIAAAHRAGAHEMILALPQGYDTRIGADGGADPLSGGQIQRIALARALFGNPVLIILDEPNASLDNEGALALNQAIRSAKAGGAAVIVMAHRPAAIQECELLMVMKDGRLQRFGPRDEVLRDSVLNAGQITRSIFPVFHQGGVA